MFNARLQSSRTRSTHGPRGPLSKMLRTMASGPAYQKAKATTLATPFDGKIAAEIALEPLDHGEGPRIGVLGDSGCGKTEAMRRMVAHYTQKVPKGITLIIDDKEANAQFVGQERRDVYDLQQRPVAADPRIVVFRGDRFDRLRGEVDPETIADLQWSMAQKRRPSMVVYDELDKAASFAMWKRGDESTIRWAFIKGRSSGAASLWGTQETQAVPREAFNQSSCLFVFRMVGNPLRLLKERGYLEGKDVSNVIATLPGDELPPNQRGYFVLLRRGRPWDEKVYRFR